MPDPEHLLCVPEASKNVGKAFLGFLYTCILLNGFSFAYGYPLIGKKLETNRSPKYTHTLHALIYKISTKQRQQTYIPSSNARLYIVDE